MAAALEHRGGFLTKRRIILLLAAAFAAAAALVWLAQARLLVFAVNRFSGGSLRAAEAKGTLVSGLHFYGVTVRTPAFRGKAIEVFLRPAMAEILAGRPALAELRAVSPRVTLQAAGDGRRPGFPAWLPSIRLAVISDGRLETGEKTFSDINCRLSCAAGKINVLSCGGNYAGGSAAFSGAYSAGRASAKGRLDYPPGKAAVDFDYSLLGERHLFSGRGAAAGAPLKLEGEINGENWKAALSLKGLLPLNAFRPSLQPVKLRSAAVSASGRGFSPGTAAAGGKFSIEEKPGSTAEGAFSFKRGSAALQASYIYGNISGSFEAAVRGGSLSGNWRAAGGGDFRLPGGRELALSGLEASCSLGGSLKAPSAVCEAEAGEIKSGDFSAGGAKFSGAVTAGRPENFKFRLYLPAPSLAKVRLDSAVLKAEGSMERNDFSIDIVYRASGAGLEGSSSLKKGSWKAELKNLSLSRAPGWRLCSPAAVSFSASEGTEVSGFCLASGAGRLVFSGIFKTSFPEEFHAAVTGFELAELGKAGLTRLKPGGVVNASAGYSGAKAGEGTFSFSAENLALEGMALGSAGARGAFAPGKARLEEARWKIYGGEAKASGWATISGGRTEADFSVKAGSMNIAPLLALLPQASAREVWLDGESRLLLGGNVLKSTGVINLSAPRLSLLPLGLELDNAGVRLEAGDLSSARISASAGRNGGKITAEGPVSASGPALKIRASDLPFSHPCGLSGKAAAELLLAGTWAEPELSGAVALRETRFEMEKWGNYKPPPGKSRFYEAMSMDLKIAAERNVWYREGANSVEVKGSLLLQKDHYRPSVVLGSVEALKGYYVYLGNTFTVNSGRMTFTGENPPNPAIELSAASGERGNPIKVYFNASGKARNPQVTLSSDPPMEQRDIISFLVTGKPLYALYASRNRAQQGRTGDNTAQNLAAGYLSQKAAATVGKKLDIDMISLKITSEKKADLTVGRYLTGDLFISYGQVLGQGGEKRVSAEYSITRHWSLEGKNSSDGRYVADLLFKYGIR
ncbi:MAG: translocation/assembly module TamB [Elusimicrobia bacterium]|nr:translocation/assembly module TamB [Elusimicrobiota bacterium]